MSYISKRGADAAKSATTEQQQDASKALVTLKSGTTLKVRVLSKDDSAEYFAASVFKVFNTTPVAPDNLYQKAANILFEQAKKAKSDAEAEELKTQARQLKPKPRYLFGFINLENGEPIVVDLSKAQAQVVYQALDKYEKKIGKVAFELSKSGTGTSTVVSFSPILDMDEDLTEVERKNFEEADDEEFPAELFEKVLYMKTEAEQIEDLKAFGFDVSLLGLEGSSESEYDF
ncbi:hypothetical protein ACTHHL_04565 [Aeribacillus composti]|uniref:hypothetical protein n=1 Tax=Aeribacillus composti TaxID=1868734 RepID=UPI00406A60F6